MTKLEPSNDRLDQVCMRRCLYLARQAERAGEVPIGAVVRLGESIVCGAHNQTVLACDPCAHAEILALRRAATALGNHRLNECVVYVSLEPCVMCAGAMIQARVRAIVYACADERFGAFSGEHSILDSHRHNHLPEVRAGVLAEPARTLLQSFFRCRRQSD